MNENNNVENTNQTLEPPVVEQAPTPVDVPTPVAPAEAPVVPETPVAPAVLETPAPAQTLNQVISNNESGIPNNPIEQKAPENTEITDTDLVVAYIGKNSEKICSKKFNFSAFFFGVFYIFYRKSFLFALIYMLITAGINYFIEGFWVTIVVSAILGFLFNNVYFRIAQNRVKKIKIKNPGKSQEELLGICAKKGGTSVGRIFLGLLAIIAISVVIAMVIAFKQVTSFINKYMNVETNTEFNINDNKLQKDVYITGHMCSPNKCTIYIEIDNGEEEYSLNVANQELFTKLKDYNDYITVDIYTNNYVINDYKITVKATNEDISNVKDEDELRTKLNLFTKGTHTETLTLKEYYAPSYCVFTSDKNIDYEMTLSENISKDLIAGQKYTVTFNVEKDMFDYEYKITDIK